MVRRGGRSKACASCRRAKKKVSGTALVERYAITLGRSHMQVISWIKQYTRRINTLIRSQCDEVYPQCGLCVAANRPCPGPIQGNVFVNTDVATIHNGAARHAANHSAQTQLNPGTRTGPSDHRPIRQRQKGSTSIDRRSDESCTLCVKFVILVNALWFYYLILDLQFWHLERIS